MKQKANLKLEKLFGIGTYWWIELFDTNQKKDVVENHVLSLIKEFEQNYSRFKANSLIGRLNDKRSLVNPPAEFVEILQYGQDLYYRSDNQFNMLLGSILENRGYDKDYSFSHKGMKEIIPSPTKDLSVSPEIITLTSGNVDLGGFGKGWLIDLITKSLEHDLGEQYFLVNGGGDMFVTSDRDTPIEIYLEHPTEKNSYLKKIYLKNQAFAASSIYKRAWRDKKSNKLQTHIIDTENLENFPSSSAFTIAPTATEADAFATVATLLGHDTKRMNQLFSKNNIGYALYRDGKLFSSQTFPELHE